MVNLNKKFIYLSSRQAKKNRKNEKLKNKKVKNREIETKENGKEFPKFRIEFRKFYFLKSK